MAATDAMSGPGQHGDLSFEHLAHRNESSLRSSFGPERNAGDVASNLAKCMPHIICKARGHGAAPMVGVAGHGLTGAAATQSARRVSVQPFLAITL
jgi:hypothetical protein